MSPRADISDKLIHFTKGGSWNEAFGTLRKIIAERRLVAGNYMIRGGYPCVCFSEAPLTAVAAGFVNSTSVSRYAPFGLMFDKASIFAAGGRPVIYQTESEFGALPAEIDWRHVRYEPIGENPIDFTWEREWRVPGDLVFAAEEAVIVLPDGKWSDHLLDIHRYEQDMHVEAYSTIFDRQIAEQMREGFSWRVVTLG